MKFKLYTLVDITETGVRSCTDKKLFCQQQNFLTILQTVGLRVNPYYCSPPKKFNAAPTRFSLGTNFRGKQTIWSFEFEIEHEEALTEEMLSCDFDLVPCISDLDESVKLATPMFSTKDQKTRNIIFNYST